MNTSHEQMGAMGPEAPQAPGTPPPVPPLAGPPGFGVPPQWNKGTPRDPRYKSPGLAGVLSIFPGVGHVYLGYNQRGFVHAIIYAGTIAILSSGNARHMEPLFGMFLAFFWFYNMIDAVRRANLINHAISRMGPGPMPALPALDDIKLPSAGGSIFGGVVLVVLGLIFLGRTRFDMNLDWLADWWPAILVIFGFQLVYKAVRKKN